MRQLINIYNITMCTSIIIQLGGSEGSFSKVFNSCKLCVNSVKSFMICTLLILWGFSEFNNFVKECFTLNLEFSGTKSA